MIKNHQKAVVCLFIAGVLSGCATSTSRRPASEGDLTLAQIIDGIKSTAPIVEANPSLCSAKYDDLYQRLYNLAGDTTYLDLNDQKSLDHDIESSFLARLALKDTLKNFTPDSNCLKSVSDVFRGLRYVEDYLIDIRMEKMVNPPTEYVNLKGEFPYLLVNPKYADIYKSSEDLHSGDLILSRGNAFSSAAIARIGTNDYQFSHISFVYKDADTKDLYTTEAHIEIGSVALPLADHISSKNSREVVFRYSDADIAHRASKSMYDRVLARQNQKKIIEYDFSMNYKEESRLYCSAIIARGFKNVLPDEDFLPKFKSKFSEGMLPFLNSIGVPVTKENVSKFDTFAPGDIQFDPRFELVAEWRNPKKMEESRIKDFILTALFERMDKAGYKFDPSFKIDMQSKTAWLLRRIPLVKKFVQDKISLTMTSSQIELFMVLDKVGDAIYKEIEKAALAYERPMTPKEIYATVDDFFKQDFELYKSYKKGEDVTTKPVFTLCFTLKD